MDRLILITGGSRSGKSLYAQREAERHPCPRFFIATCQVGDREMAARVKKHREARREADWQTIEEPLDLACALARTRHGTDGGTAPGGEHAPVILVDCLTIWISNLLYEAERNGRILAEEDIAAACRQVLAVCRRTSGTILLVTGEVGMGIIPDNPLARLYRDCVGTCNQLMAAAADRVTLVNCGLPLTLKG